MSNKEQVIAELQEKLNSVEQEANKIKRAINLLCELDDKPAIYTDFDKPPKGNTQLKGDEYHNLPLATAITEIMERRRSAKIAPVTIDEIYDDLLAGGFQLMKGKNEGIQKRGLAIAMSKNRKFYKLPNEKWGIKSWYNIKDAKDSLSDIPVLENNTNDGKRNDDSEINEDQ